jgi:hypothetical protein
MAHPLGWMNSEQKEEYMKKRLEKKMKKVEAPYDDYHPI